MPEDNDYETTTINIGSKLKRQIEEYNYHNRKSKINVSEVCRNALKEELEKRG